MSFTTEISGELVSLQIKKTCCRKAAALGVFCSAKGNGDGSFTSYFYDEGTAALAKELLKRIFHSDATLYETVRVGRKTFVLSFSCSGIADFLRHADSGEASDFIDGIFRCPICMNTFLRGVFLGCGSITDPQKGYHMELSFPNTQRASLIASVLERIIGEPRRIQRGAKHCLYYKNNGAILDFLYCIGSNHSGLYMANSFIERDIRNNENRATNCVARNISRSVSAAQKQLAAIEKLRETGKLESLPEELQYTAGLRVENESASMTELAALHDPPISKSGLNGRLQKLMEAAEKL